MLNYLFKLTYIVNQLIIYIFNILCNKNISHNKNIYNREFMSTVAEKRINKNKLRGMESTGGILYQKMERNRKKSYYELLKEDDKKNFISPLRWD